LLKGHLQLDCGSLPLSFRFAHEISDLTLLNTDLLCTCWLQPQCLEAALGINGLKL
jgi:hypothetical protein